MDERRGWAQRLQAISQIGLAYAAGPYDRDRYEQIRTIAIEMAAAVTDAEPGVVAAAFAAQDGYATPKVDTRVAAFDAVGRVLLVRDAGDGGWTLPGGWGDVGSSPAENAIREVREESGYDVTLEKLVAVFDRERHPHVPKRIVHIYKLFFLGTIVGGEATPSVETTEIGFFGEAELPPLSLERITPDELARTFAHRRDSTLPTEYD